MPGAHIPILATGHPEFDLLISHVHPDHFDLVSTLRFLKYHPSTVVVAPDRVSAQIRNALASNQQAASQVHAAPLKPEILISHEEDGVQVESFPLTHGNVENPAYLVILNGRAVLHIGDADLPYERSCSLHKRFDAVEKFRRLLRTRSL